MSLTNQKSRLLFIGTGSLDVYPKPGCNDLLCKAARRGGKDRRIQAGLIYNRILIDCGEGVPERIKDWNLEDEFDAVVISHPHRDHIWGLQTFDFKDKEIFVPFDSRYLYHKLFPEFKFKYYYCLKENEIVGESMLATRIFHSPSVFNHAFRFDNFVYAQDIGKLDSNFGSFVEGAKMVIGDAFNFDKDFVIQENYFHVSMKKQIDFYERKKVESLIFDGVGHHTQIPHEYLELKLWDYVNDKGYNIKVHLAFDGLSIVFK